MGMGSRSRDERDAGARRLTCRMRRRGLQPGGVSSLWRKTTGPRHSTIPSGDSTLVPCTIAPPSCVGTLHEMNVSPPSCTCSPRWHALSRPPRRSGRAPDSKPPRSQDWAWGGGLDPESMHYTGYGCGDEGNQRVRTAARSVLGRWMRAGDAPTAIHHPSLLFCLNGHGTNKVMMGITTCSVHFPEDEAIHKAALRPVVPLSASPPPSSDITYHCSLLHGRQTPIPVSSPRRRRRRRRRRRP